MDLAYADKIAKDSNGVKYLLVPQDLFDGTVDATGRRTKHSKETVRAFLIMIIKKNRPKKIWVDKRTEIAGGLEKVCVTEGIRIYSTRTEAKAALVERTVRPLKKIIYRYLDHNGYKYNQKLTQIVTTLNSKTVCLIDSISKNVRNSGILFILYNKPLQEFWKSKIQGDGVCISKYDLSSGSAVSHILHRKFLKVLHYLPEEFQLTQ